MMRFDWGALLRAGLGGAALSPAAFWRLTPVELLLVLGVAPGAAPLTRARLADLERAFPDQSKG
ncbi:MAG: phage tail assembly chaperone [Paracoccaceae bacterium]|nr:phage tail assembly chaperone [Paracoccaceae bacterium]